RGQRFRRSLADAGSGAKNDRGLAGKIERGAIACQTLLDVVATHGPILHSVLRLTGAARRSQWADAQVEDNVMRLFKSAFFGLLIALAPMAAGAQDFPNKGPIKIIVPFPAGGPNDIIARAVGQKMSEILKQKVIIDNRGGAGGVLGTEMVAEAD